MGYNNIEYGLIRFCFVHKYVYVGLYTDQRGGTSACPPKVKNVCFAAASLGTGLASFMCQRRRSNTLLQPQLNVLMLMDIAPSLLAWHRALIFGQASLFWSSKAYTLISASYVHCHILISRSVGVKIGNIGTTPSYRKQISLKQCAMHSATVLINNEMNGWSIIAPE